jgi:hypothetical protein
MPQEASKTASPKFTLGRQVGTPAALKEIHEAGQSALQFLARHVAGDWGDLDDEDKRLNDEALKDGSRLLSAYNLRSGVRIWVITEAADDSGHRAATTILLPDEY